MNRKLIEGLPLGNRRRAKVTSHNADTTKLTAFPPIIPIS